MSREPKTLLATTVRRQALRTRRAWPLWTWAVFAAGAVGFVVTGGCVTGLAVAGRLSSGSLALCLVLGALGTVVAALAAAFAADSAADALRTMRDDAVARLRNPDTLRPASASRGVRASAEMADLDAALEALALRMRVAEDLATRSRLTAEHTSAGMFELLSGAIAAEEGARGQLAAELHDTVAQSLALAQTFLRDGRPEQATHCLIEAEDQVRAIMARTRPAALREGDLATAVSGFCADLEHRYGLRVRIDWPPDARPMPVSTAVTIYRFFQESLLNVAKHAEVDQAEVALVFEAERVRATVADRGSGFDPASVRPHRGRHVGLGLLRERVRLAGGQLDIAAAPGRGSRVSMTMPLRLRPAVPPVPAEGSAVNGYRASVSSGDQAANARR